MQPPAKTSGGCRLLPATAARARLKTASSLQRVIILRAFGVFCLKQRHSCTSELMPPPCLHTCTRRAKRAAVALNCRTATRASHAVCVWGGHASSTGRERGRERERGQSKAIRLKVEAGSGARAIASRVCCYLARQRRKSRNGLQRRRRLSLQVFDDGADMQLRQFFTSFFWNVCTGAQYVIQ